MMLLLLLTACQPQSPAVTFAVFGDPAEYAAYQNLAEAFRQAHPEIDLELRHIPSQAEYRQRLAADFMGGSPSDVVLLNHRRLVPFAQSGGIVPLDQFLDDSDLITATDFYPIALEAFRWEGQLWCIPQNISSLVVYYNQDLFDDAGLPYPTDKWTWDDFLSAAQTLTQDMDDDGRIDQYGVGLSPNLFRLAPFVWQNGGTLFDDPHQPTRMTLDQPAARAALAWFTALQTEHGVVPDALAETAIPAENRFLNGTLAMYFNSRRGTPTYRAVAPFRWDVAPLPQAIDAAGVLHSDGYCMSAAAQNKPNVWTFIEFANSPAGQQIVLQSGRTVPSLIAVAESPEFLQPNTPPQNSRVFIDTVPTLRRVPTIAAWPPLEEQLSKEIEQAFYGHTSVDEAIRRSLTIAAQIFAAEN